MFGRDFAGSASFNTWTIVEDAIHDLVVLAAQTEVKRGLELPGAVPGPGFGGVGAATETAVRPRLPALPGWKKTVEK